MTLVGELVLARNQILQFSASQEDAAFLGTVQRLNLLTTELQAGVMKTRMQPIGNVWSKFPRVVRDLAVACGKQVRLEMEGQETELDKTIIEAIRDPLTHLVRNAVDHGIETARRSGSSGASPPRAGLSCTPSTRAARSSSRSPTTAAASTRSASATRPIRAKLVTPEQADRLDRPRAGQPHLPARASRPRTR